MVYVIALTSKLVFLLATFTPGPEIPLENKELPSLLDCLPQVSFVRVISKALQFVLC